MNTTYRVTAEQVANLRNNIIITEALADPKSATTTADLELADDYNDEALANVNRKPNDPTPNKQEAADSDIYGNITKALYNYAQTYSLPTKIATEIEAADSNISEPMAKTFIEKLLYGIFRMAQDPAQNMAFERLLQSIGDRYDPKLLTKDNTTK
jgi:hypothetical protein